MAYKLPKVKGDFKGDHLPSYDADSHILSYDSTMSKYEFDQENKVEISNDISQVSDVVGLTTLEVPDVKKEVEKSAPQNGHLEVCGEEARENILSSAELSLSDKMKSSDGELKSEEITGPPPSKMGWLVKHSHGSIFKTTNKRYFVLSDGVLSYYEKSLPTSPYGFNIRDSAQLNGANVEIRKHANKSQLYIRGDFVNNDLLLDADDMKEVDSWKYALLLHIQYASRNDSSASQYIKPKLSKRASSANIKKQN
jgi:hypothetical protein